MATALTNMSGSLYHRAQASTRAHTCTCTCTRAHTLTDTSKVGVGGVQGLRVEGFGSPLRTHPGTRINTLVYSSALGQLVGYYSL